MLLLDEPTTHLDAESVAWLERYLKDFAGCVVAVTHDRYFLDNVAGWILELDRGRGIPYEGNYTGWLEQKKTRLAVEEKTESARQRTLQHELEWVRMSPRARQAKNKARIQKFEELASDNQYEKIAQNEIQIPPPPRLGNDVVIADDLKKAYGDKVLIDGLSFALPRGGIVGIIGPNGAGKTTLFRMITGREQPDGGTLRVGETVVLAGGGGTRLWPLSRRARPKPFLPLLGEESLFQLTLSRIPLGCYGQPEDVAYGVLYLASDESRWVTGSELVIDGGWTAQ